MWAVNQISPFSEWTHSTNTSMKLSSVGKGNVLKSLQRRVPLPEGVCVPTHFPGKPFSYSIIAEALRPTAQPPSLTSTPGAVLSSAPAPCSLQRPAGPAVLLQEDWAAGNRSPNPPRGDGLGQRPGLKRRRKRAAPQTTRDHRGREGPACAFALTQGRVARGGKCHRDRFVPPCPGYNRLPDTGRGVR